MSISLQKPTHTPEEVFETNERWSSRNQAIGKSRMYWNLYVSRRIRCKADRLICHVDYLASIDSIEALTGLAFLTDLAAEQNGIETLRPAEFWPSHSFPPLFKALYGFQGDDLKG